MNGKKYNEKKGGQRQKKEKEQCRWQRNGRDVHRERKRKQRKLRKKEGKGDTPAM